MSSQDRVQVIYKHKARTSDPSVERKRKFFARDVSYKDDRPGGFMTPQIGVIALPRIRVNTIEVGLGLF
jgi:hypothetical protein